VYRKDGVVSNDKCYIILLLSCIIHTFILAVYQFEDFS